jgi:type VI secretion system secreted protein VgrG
MSELRQDKRIGQLNTPLGKDKLVLVGFECDEGVSEKFEIRVQALSSEKNINFDEAIGQNCTITVEMERGKKRYFDGVMAEARWVGGDEFGDQKYVCVLKSWLWLLSFRKNSLIFHEKTAPEIIEQIFGEHGFAVFSNNLSRGYPTLEYCVQYKETDMDFVCRLMEECGISYYFKHSDGEHKLILADEMTTFEAIPGGSRQHLPNPGRHTVRTESFHTFVPKRSFTSGTIKFDEHDFMKSTSDLVVNAEISPPFEPSGLEVFHYPGRYVETSDGQKLAEAWRDMERAKDGHFEADGICVTCFSGALVTIEDKSNNGFDAEYLALRCEHRFGKQTYRGRAEQGVDDIYQGRFEFIKSDKTYAPPRLTQKALVEGPQTAEVVGDGEIDVDEYGRILVRFYWDQKGDKSRRCRVMQVWAGNKWGGIYTPRVGMEVVVAFEEGDPDKPLVIGTVYNDKHMPPFTLPDDKTIAGIKSNSSPGGGGYNEFVLEDKAGKELIRLHAQKDLESTVEHDETRSVANNRSTSVGANDTLSVGDTLKIDARQKVEITVGTSKITMTPEKITVQSMTIEVNGQTLTDIKGAIVKINS